MQKTLILIFFTSLLSYQPAHALTFESYGVGYGVLNSGLLAQSVGSDGKTSFLGSSTYHFLAAHLRWSGMKYKYGLRLGYTLLPRESADGAVKITQMVISPQFGVPLGPQLLWNTSLGLLSTQSKGQGGSVVLNNGTGTLTFYRPSDSVTSQLINLETGLQYTFVENWYLSGDLFFNGLLGEKRNVSLFINFGYSWGAADGGGSYQSF